MKSNIKRPNARTILFAIPMMLLFVALIVIACVSFNKGIDYKTYYQFDVRFNTTINQQDFDKYSDKIGEIAKNNNLNIYSKELINEGVNSGIMVKVIKPNATKDSVMTDRIANMQADIKEITGINSNAVITVNDAIRISPNNWSNQLLTGLVSIAVALIVVFGYIWYRFEIKTALSYLVGVAVATGMTLSLIAIFRLPLSINYMMPYFFVLAMFTILFVVLFSAVRADNNKDNATNQEVVTMAFKDCSRILITLIVALAGTFVLSAVVFETNTFSMLIQVLFALISCVYALLFNSVPMWTKLYNKQKDTRLKARQERALDKENNKSNKPSDNDKLIV